MDNLHFPSGRNKFMHVVTVYLLGPAERQGCKETRDGKVWIGSDPKEGSMGGPKATVLQGIISGSVAIGPLEAFWHHQLPVTTFSNRTFTSTRPVHGWHFIKASRPAESTSDAPPVVNLC